MAASELTSKLADLHSILTSTQSAHPSEKARDLVVDIGHICLKELPENELAFICSELFNKETGVLKFLQRSVTKDEFKTSKEQMLEFLQAFLVKAGSRLLEHAVDIKDVCVSLFTRDDRAAKVRAKTFDVLVQVIKLTAGSGKSNELGIKKLIEKYFTALMQPSKLSQSVKHGIYEVLGVIAEVYPTDMVPYHEKLLKIYLAMFNKQMTSKTHKPEMTVLAGGMLGLKHYLVNFTHSVEEDSPYTKDIYRYARMAIDTNVKNQRYELNVEALELFGQHAGQFNKLLYDDHEVMYDAFLFWSEHRNSQCRKAGFVALNAFLQQISEMLVQRATQNQTGDKAVFKYFIQKFRGIIDNPQSDTKALSSAIKGYGFFAAPCKMFMSEDDVKFMFNEMIQRSEQLYLQQGDMSEDSLTQLPDFLDALASIVQHLKELSDSFLGSLERLVVIQFSNYPRIPRYKRYQCHGASLRVLIALSAKGATLKNFLSRVVYQALVRTCSHPVLMELNELPEGAGGVEGAGESADIKSDARRVSYKSYIDLWKHLLDSMHMKEMEALSMSYVDRSKIHQMIYGELIAATLRILSKLDLTSNKQGQGESQNEAVEGPSDTSETDTDASSDPLHGLQATKPMDFQVFINLVEFCRELLPSRQLHYFEQWVYSFGHQLILLSSHLPLVSGFYKMLTICMEICCKIGYFKDIYGPLNQPDDYMEVDSQSASGVTTSDRQASFLLFAKFAKEVHVRLKQYKDDLLASCLFFVLSLPHEIVQSEVISVVPALQTTFKIGVSYLPLAEAGLTALNSWLKHLPMETLRPHFNAILPLLDDYLRATSEQGSTFQTVISRPETKRHGRRKIKGSRLLKDLDKQQEIQDSPLRTVQLKILHFLGSLGGQTNACLLETSADEIAKEAVAWDTQPRLQFAVPFVDMKPNINLDPFLPRVVELALTSGDRQAKVAACESLHTLVLYMLGKGTQQPEQRQTGQGTSPMRALYRHIFPALLQLACDVEQVARQLFEPLVLQLIHWFTGNKKFESEETVTFLTAMLEGVVHPTHTALRDFCARCLKEFLRWSIKQTSKKQQEKSPINAKSLLKRLYSMALHPNAFKRLGAALAFNNIYTVFREETSLVDQFAFEVLVTYVQSLAMAHSDDKALGTQEQGVEVLKHLERIIRVKADMLNKESKHRRTPRDFHSDVCPTLSRMIVWLLLQCGRPQTECRHQCMMLVFKLATLLPGKNSAQVWMQNTLKESGADYFVSRFEGGGGRGSHKSGIAKYPSLDKISQSAFSIKLACSWFDMLLAALDCYTWVFGEKLLQPSVLFTDVAKKPSFLFQAIQYFITNIAMTDLKTVSQSKGATQQVFTPREVDQYNQSKCTVTVRLMDFMTVLLGNYANEAVKVLPMSLWKGKLMDLVVACVLEPTAVGFNMADVEIMSNLPRTTGQLLSLLSTRLPSTMQADLKRAVTNRIRQSQQDLFQLLPTVFHGEQEQLDHAKLTHLVSGYEQLHQARLMEAAISKPNTPLESLSSQILQCVFDGLAKKDSDDKLLACDMSPTAVDLGDRLLKLAFKMGVQPKLLVANLGKDIKLATSSAATTSDLNLTHGMAFYSTFRSSINEELAAHAQQAIPPLIWDASRSDSGSVLNGLLDHVATNRELRKKHGKAVHSIILTKWDTITGGLRKGCGQDLQSFVLLLLRKLLQIDSSFCSKSSHPTYKCVLSTYVTMLTDPATSLTFKAQVMDIMYFFTTVPEQDQEIKDALHCVIADNFPLKSSEFRVGSPKYNDYIAALNKILTALVLSGSLMLLEVLISIMCREDKHIYEDEIQTTLASFIKRLPAAKQTEAFIVAYKVFRQEDNFPMEIRRQAIERVCIPLMRLCSTQALVEFFKANIKEVTGIIDAKTIKSPEMAFESQLVSKICCFELIEIMYSRLTKEDLNSPQSVINKAYFDGSVKTGKEMTQSVTKAGHSAKSEDIRGETASLELRRQYHCAAFNALIAIISCTQTEVKFYSAFLFNENPAKGQFLLDNMMDSDKVYSFELEQDAPIQRKKKFVSIRSQVRRGGGDGSQSPESGYMSTFTAGPGRYMSSQYLADSSLSEEISVFDYSGAIGQFSGSPPGDDPSQGSSNGRVKSEISQDEPSSTVHGEYMELESDELNQHECMASMTAVLKHMQTNKITPQIAEGSQPSELPDWMSKLQKKFSSSTKMNVKLFIARLLMNNPEMFEPYAKFWLGPLLEMVLTVGEHGLNYMILDMVVLCLSWSTIAKPGLQEKRLANKVLEFLMAHCNHEARNVMRNNLDMVKTMIECWKEIVEVPTRVIYNSMKPQPGGKTETAIGVQLLGLVLANKLHPISPNTDVEEGRFYAALCANLSNRYKMVHAAAGEVVGMAMKQMADVDKVTDGSLHEEVHKTLTQVAMNAQEIFITCIHKIHLHYPVFADRYTNKLLFIMPSIYGQPKTLCLEVIASRIDNISNAFMEVKNKGIIELLTHRDEATQLVALKLVNSMLHSLKPTELLYLLPSVKTFSGHHSPGCREVMYDILMWVYDNYRNQNGEEDSRREEGADDVLVIAKDTLLQGLSDEEPGHRIRVSNFWSHETRLPTGTLDRMVAMLECMYSPSTEHQYLSYSTSLLLEMTSKSPDFKREVFEHPLQECKFEEITIDHSWKKRNLAISTPMFVETQASQSSSGSGGSLSQTGSDTLSGQVRQTQDVQQFTATQDIDAIASRKNAYNWLTGSQDTFADYSASVSSDQSSLLFTVGASSKKSSKGSKRAVTTQANVGAGFGQQRLRPDQDEADSRSGGMDKEVLRLKKRFLKDQAATSAFFMKRAVREKQFREEAVKEQRERRFAVVTMYRRYRAGDLPDIQIKYSDLIAPLQALAQRDASLARLLFSALFNGIFGKIEEEKTEREAAKLTADINQHLNAMMSSSTQFYPPFVSCIQEVSYHQSKQLTLDPSAVSTASLTSQQLFLGVRLLEEKLIQNTGEEERASKRARMTAAEPTEEISTWIELARLYKALGEFDVLQGIFGGRIGTREITKVALEAEARGDFKQALEKYTEALDSDGGQGSVQQVEEDLWDENRLHCCEQLTQWKDLEDFAIMNIDDQDPPDLDKMWSDPYNQEHYLPAMIRSKLKQLLEGREDETLLQFIDSAMQNPENPERKLYLEARHSGELAALYTIQEDYNRAKFYINKCLQGFLVDWCGLGKLMSSSRLAKLQEIQRLTEAQQFLQLMTTTGIQGNDGVYKAQKMFDQWQVCYPDSKRDPISVWDDVVLNRCLYMDKVAGKFVQSLSQDTATLGNVETQFEERILKERLNLGLKIANSASEQSNFSVAQKHLKNTYRSLSGHEELRPLWTHSYVKMHQTKAALMQPSERVTTLLTTFDPLAKLTNRPVLTSDPSLTQTHHVLTSKSFELVGLAVQDGGGELIDSLRNAGKLDKLLDLAGPGSKQPDEIVKSLLSKAHTQLKQAVNSADEMRDQVKNKDSITAAYMAFVSFCDNILRQKDADESTTQSLPDTNSYPTCVVKYTLQAMRYNSVEAMQRFPRLLQLVEVYPDVMDLMIKQASHVPCWMFISWISQMVALLDKREAPSVQKILASIADMYPEALCYPFKISSEDFTFEKSPGGKKNLEAVTKLRSVLDNVPMIDSFTKALEQLTNPEHIFKDWMDDVMKPLLNASGKRDTAKIKKIYQDFYSTLLDYRATQSASYDDSQSQSVAFGDFRRKFAQNLQKKFEAAFGKDGSKLVTMQYKIFGQQCGKLKKEIDEINRKRQMPGNLKEYCTWLSDFQSRGHDRELEIPGQYGGKSKPMPEYHVKIAGFDEKVLVLGSIRKPKRITILGNDEKEYQFLVKGGEDLRLDQRVEQLFCMMNDILQQDSACSQRGLKLVTYEVIPMTPRIGMIEWVANTDTLKSFLEKAMTEDELKAYKQAGPNRKQMEFVGKYQTGKSAEIPKTKYQQIYLKAGYTEMVRAFRQWESMVSWDLLRRAFLQMSASPEAFHTLRTHFARTHATLSICQYLLGIGDRHLSNFLVSQETGGMIGIDFGHAFGSATQFLPVPEMLPFRLSRQFLNLMLPFKKEGLLQNTMVHTLRALRQNHELLLNTMDVFVKEPSLDWKTNATKQAAEGFGETDGESEEDISWYPMQKVNFAKLKLQGANPTFITRSELELGHSKSPAFGAFKAAAKGDRKSIRASKPDKGLNVETQVECLIEQATDPNILGRTWVGWESWM